MAEFAGKKVFVTGGSKGIGRSIVHAFLQQGADVFTNGTNGAGLAETRETAGPLGEAHLVTAIGDLADSGTVCRLAEEARAVLGGVDILVNNAALHDYMHSALDQDLDIWTRVIAINLTAPFLLSRALLPSMVAAGGGAIVNISSAAGIVAGGGGVSYTSSKHGLIGLTRQLALEFGPKGIRVNAVCPGITQTPALNTALEGPGAESLRAFIAGTPARRVAQPEEIARSVLFLAGSNASFMDGSVLTVDGGYTIY